MSTNLDTIVSRQFDNPADGQPMKPAALRRLGGVLLAGVSAIILAAAPAASGETIRRSTSDSSRSSRDHRLTTSGRQKGMNTMEVYLLGDVLMVEGSVNQDRVMILGGAKEVTIQWRTEGDGSGWQNATYDAEDVGHIFAMMDEGNDRVFNLSIVSSTQYGGPGNDVLIGGMSGDVLYGETGGDVLFGGGESDTLEGGPQSDVLCGGFPFPLYVTEPEGVNAFLLDLEQVEFNFEMFDEEWITSGYHTDLAVDSLRGGPEDPALDADWFVQEVIPVYGEGTPVPALENDILKDFIEDFDQVTFSDHYWE